MNIKKLHKKLHKLVYLFYANVPTFFLSSKVRHDVAVFAVLQHIRTPRFFFSTSFDFQNF